jgi:aromatic-amino-acid transaminase
MDCPPSPEVPRARSRAARARGPRRAIVDGRLGVLLDDDGRPIVLSALKRALRELPDDAWIPYAPPGGEEGFRDAVRREVLGRDPELAATAAVLATPGATGAIKLALGKFLAPGQAAIVADHHWKPYADIAAWHGRSVTTCAMLGADGAFDAAALDGALAEVIARQRRALLIVNDPCHNPTGATMDAAAWAAVAGVVAARARQAPIAVLLDAAYADFAPAGASIALAALARLARSAPATVAVAWSASKAFTAYGLRTGALLAVAPGARRDARLEAALTQASLASWGNCNRGGMLAVARLLDDAALAAAARAERQAIVGLLATRAAALAAAVRRHGLVQLPHHGGFFATVLTRDPARAVEVMRRERVLVHAGPGSIRIALSAVAARDVAPAIEVLARAAQEAAR